MANLVSKSADGLIPQLQALAHALGAVVTANLFLNSSAPGHIASLALIKADDLQGTPSPAQPPRNSNALGESLARIQKQKLWGIFLKNKRIQCIILCWF